MAAVTFAAGLGGYLAGKPKLNIWQKRLKKVLDARPSTRRTWFLKALEARARDHLGVSATAAIDWSAINWSELLTAILKFLLMILPLFL